MATIGAPGQQTMGLGVGDIFKNSPKVLIKQEMALVEMCSCEAKQRYRISAPGPENTEGPVFLYISEESQCLERICCGPNRSLTLKVHEGSSKDGPVVQTMHKDFSCQGCCCLRPSFRVFGQGGTNTIGSIEDPCRCCVMDQQIFNKDRNLLFTTYGSICQPGLCCPCCCDVGFDVNKNGQKVASISKMALSCTEMFVKTNRFLINFEKINDPVEKRMLLSSAMLLDLEYFEQQK